MVRFLYPAVEAIETGDARAHCRAVRGVFDILIRFQDRLPMNGGGTPAKAMSDFYAAMFALALQGSRERSKAKCFRRSTAFATCAKLSLRCSFQKNRLVSDRAGSNLSH